jgi:hypothetical protein
VQVVKLVGVVDDGSVLRPNVPANTAKTIQIPRLNSVTLAVEVVNNAGVPVDLTDSTPAFEAWFTFVKSPGPRT